MKTLTNVLLFSLPKPKSPITHSHTYAHDFVEAKTTGEKINTKEKFTAESSDADNVQRWHVTRGARGGEETLHVKSPSFASCPRLASMNTSQKKETTYTHTHTTRSTRAAPCISRALAGHAVSTNDGISVWFISSFSNTESTNTATIITRAGWLRKVHLMAACACCCCC